MLVRIYLCRVYADSIVSIYTITTFTIDRRIAEVHGRVSENGGCIVMYLKEKLVNKIWACVWVLAIFHSSPVFSDVVFSAPPRENQERGEKIYGPLVKYLSKILHEEVVYKHPDGWARYTKDMRAGKYDIIFDGPHFGAWRIKNIDHVPVAKLPGTLTFVILANSSSTHINTERDLIGIDICALASPNLGTVVLYNIFNNPVNVPQIHEVTGGFKAVYRSLKQGKCKAAVVRDNLYYALKEEEKRMVKIIVKTKPMPNQTITVSKRLAKKLAILSKSLTSAEGARSSQKLLSRFSKNKKIFKSAKVREYKNIENLLTGVVWGW